MKQQKPTPQRGINDAFRTAKFPLATSPTATSAIPEVLDDSSTKPANPLVIDEPFADSDSGSNPSLSANARTLKAPAGAPLVPRWLFTQDAPDWPARLARLKAVNRQVTNKQLLLDFETVGLDVPGRTKNVFTTKAHYNVYLDMAIAFARSEAGITEGVADILPLPNTVHGPDPPAPVGDVRNSLESAVAEIEEIPEDRIDEIELSPDSPADDRDVVPDSQGLGMADEALPIPNIPNSRATSSTAPSLKRAHSEDEGTRSFSETIPDTNVYV